jgi:phosphohistidine swiveling domain-containing protein
MPSLSFSTTGPAIVEHMRGLVHRGDWRSALSDAKDIFPDVGEEPLIEILKGNKTLVGRTSDPGGIDYIDDRDEAYRDHLSERYDGATLIDGMMYRPVSVITDYGRHDQIGEAYLPDHITTEDQASLSNFDRSELMNRALFYANGNKLAKAILCELPTKKGGDDVQTFAVIFEPTLDVPSWIKPAPNTQSAAEQRLSRLDYIGHEALYPEKNQSSSLPPEEERKAAILKQNQDLGYGLRAIDFGAKIGVRQVPLAPLIVWAAGHLRSYQKVEAHIPNWVPQNPSGLKVNMDDPTHTDWMLAAGLLDPNLWGKDLDTRMWQISEDLQVELTGAQLHVLAAGKSTASGIIKFCKSAEDVDENTIAIVPNASVRYYEVALKAAATIVIEGGAMSHLAVNGLADKLFIVRISSAKASFKDGDHVTLDIEKGIALKTLAGTESTVHDYQDSSDPSDTVIGSPHTEPTAGRF